MNEEFSEYLETKEKSFDEKIQEIEDSLGDSFSGKSYETSDEIPLFDIEDADDENEFFSSEKKSERHPLSLQARLYSDGANQWLFTVTGTCRTDFTRWLALGTADLIFAALDTVNWYHYFIYPKILRALSGYFEMEDDEIEVYDMNGSAKVTLIGIDRSIESFKFLKRHLKSHQIEIADLSKKLTDLRSEIEELFPEARSFIRPGLDE